MFKKGDIVVRKSYGKDIIFSVKYITDENVAVLSALRYRLRADAPLGDLEPFKRDSLINFKKVFSSDVDVKIGEILKARRFNLYQENEFIMPGRVLHIDADENYLQVCMMYYDKLCIPAEGIYIEETSQPLVIEELLREKAPDILILTGHDSISRNADDSDIDNYKSSKFFVEAVKKARHYQSSKDSLAIFAGACQSFYKDIMDAGANFASSPERVLIHALDPVFIAEKISYTPASKMLSIDECIENTVTGLEGIGGVETRGSLRVGKPDLK